jgi:RNA polymerase sigma factor (sigma-70 family)
MAVRTVSSACCLLVLPAVAPLAARPQEDPMSEALPDICDPFATKYIRQAARRLIADRVFPRGELDDLVQELRLALLECRASYDPAKARWTYFVKTIIDRKSVSLRRLQSAESRGNMLMVASLNVVVRDGDGQLVELSQQIEQSEGGSRRGIEHTDRQAELERSLNVAAVLELLDPDLAEICHRLAQESLTTVARQLGIPRTTLISRLARVRAKFAAADLDTCL